MEADFTSPMGILVFFPLTALLSVPLTAAILSYSLRGMVLVTNEKQRSFYRGMFIIAAILNAIFLPAVVRYQWLSPQTVYDSLYHYLYFVNIVLFIATSSRARQDGVSTGRVIGIPLIAAYIYLFILNLLGPALEQSGASSSTGTSMFLGAIFAGIQIIAPIIERGRARNERQEYIMKLANSGNPLTELGVQQKFAVAQSEQPAEATTDPISQQPQSIEPTQESNPPVEPTPAADENSDNRF